MNTGWRSFIFPAFFLIPLQAAGSETPTIRLSPEDNEHWRIEYSLTQPATALTLIRDSGGTRQNRWRLPDPDFEFFDDGEREIIRRKDGASFDRVSVIESTRYSAPAKGYLSFARFSDGGLLIYTGEFHACEGACLEDSDISDGPWRITIDPGEKTRMIVKGAVKNGKATFTDAGDGTKVYVGNAEIIEDSSLLAVIDPGLPPAIKSKLDTLFPPLMEYFGNKLWPLREKQMLFVSWDVPGTEKGAHSKGGTLPGQVFIHFEGAQIPEQTASEDYPYFLSWFFAHEAGHLHQRYRDAQFDESESWIHEGGADALAYTALKNLNAASEGYLLKRLTKAKQNCAAALNEGRLRDAAERNAFQAYYDCGVLMHLAAARSAERNSGADLFSLWREYIGRIESGAPWTASTFVSVVADLGDAETAALIETMATQDIENPAAFLKHGLAEMLPEALTDEAAE